MLFESNQTVALREHLRTHETFIEDHRRFSASCRRNLVLIDLLLIFGGCPGIFRSTSAFFRSLTTAGDNRDRCQDTRLGQQSNLAHDRLLKFMALICGFV